MGMVRLVLCSRRQNGELAIPGDVIQRLRIPACKSLPPGRITIYDYLGHATGLRENQGACK
jgi:hypothetical protein